MKYSIIFLVEQESEEFSKFFDLIYGIFEKQSEEFEILVVANGTEGFVTSCLNSLKKHVGNLKIAVFQRKVNQPVCLKVALYECSGTEFLTLGPFQELLPDSYENIIHSMIEGVDIVVPYRRLRKDAFLNRLHSRLLNSALNWVTGSKLQDIGCSVRFFKREVLESLDLYGNMYKYFPALAAQKGFKVKEIECGQSEKFRKVSFYSLRLYLGHLIEILNLFFSTRFSKKPLRFFNLVGATVMFIGLMALCYVGFQKVFWDIPIGTRSLLIIGMICFVGGTQITGFGLLGEIISFVYGRSRQEYTIEKII